MAAANHTIAVLAPEETPEGRGRIIHALTTARDLIEAEADVEIFFEGIGVTCLTAFHKRDNPFTQAYGELFDEVRPSMAGTCDFCTRRRFGAEEGAAALGIPIIGGEDRHHSLAPLLDAGTQLHTF